MTKKDNFDDDILIDQPDIGCYYHGNMFRFPEEELMRPQPPMKGSPMMQKGGFMNQATTPQEMPSMDEEPLMGAPVLSNIGYTQAYLKTLIGKRVRISFLIGTSLLVDRVGTLLEVGISYVVLRQLDAKSLITVRLVCHEMRHLSDEPVLWKKLSKRTHRIVGDLTKYAIEQHAKNRKSWKLAYFWITQEDLRIFESDLKLTEYATSIETDALKKFYIYARGIETLFPKSAPIYREFAEFILERPDIDGSWELAHKFFKNSLVLAHTFLYGKNEKLLLKFDSNEFVKELFPRVIKMEVEPNPNEPNEAKEQVKNTFVWALLRYSHFLTNHIQDYGGADTCYKILMKVLPNNSYLLERYAEFLSECLHKHDLADRVFRMILGGNASGNTVASYAIFLWHVRRNYPLATKCFKIASQLSPDKVYYYANFLGRHVKDEASAKVMLLESKLYKYVEENPSESDVFALALAFHQIHCVDEAEKLYRTHLQSNKNVYSLSNLAELLLHSRRNFEEAEKLYMNGLNLASSARETIEVALAGLRLAQGREGALQELETLLNSSHVKYSRNTFTEAWILYFIHCLPYQKSQALSVVKHQLVTLAIRPKLILMFDANLDWARKHNIKDWQWMIKLTSVYNCELEIEDLDSWDEWNSLSVPREPEDTSYGEELPTIEDDEEEDD